MDAAQLAAVYPPPEVPFLYRRASIPIAPAGGAHSSGSALSTVGAIMPATAGHDIGCGMIAVQTTFSPGHLRRLRRPLADLGNLIEMVVPTAAQVACRKLSETAELRLDRLETQAASAGFDPKARYPDWRLQFGSLGVGNHFLGFYADEQDAVWLAAHCGSLGVGRAIADHHISHARELTDRYSPDVSDSGFGYLIEGTAAFASFVRESQWAQHYAAANRAEIVERASECLSDWLGSESNLGDSNLGVTTLHPDPIDSHHNSTRKEHHLGNSVWVTRRGAIDAHTGVMGVVPAASGSALCIVEGLGNHAALCSLVHGRCQPLTTDVIPTQSRRGSQTGPIEDGTLLPPGSHDVVTLHRVLNRMVTVLTA